MSLLDKFKDFEQSANNLLSENKGLKISVAQLIEQNEQLESQNQEYRNLLSLTEANDDLLADKVDHMEMELQALQDQLEKANQFMDHIHTKNMNRLNKIKTISWQTHPSQQKPKSSEQNHCQRSTNQRPDELEDAKKVINELKEQLIRLEENNETLNHKVKCLEEIEKLDPNLDYAEKRRWITSL